MIDVSSLLAEEEEEIKSVSEPVVVVSFEVEEEDDIDFLHFLSLSRSFF